MILRSLDVQLLFSKGFHKLPKINYIFPLPLGVDGENEILIIEVGKLLNIEELKHQFNSKIHCGLHINNIFHIEAFKVESAIATYRFDVDLFSNFTKLMNSKCDYYVKLNKKNENKTVKLKEYLMGYGDNKVTVRINNAGTINFVDFFKYWNYYNTNSLIAREIIKIK